MFKLLPLSLVFVCVIAMSVAQPSSERANAKSPPSAAVRPAINGVVSSGEQSNGVAVNQAAADAPASITRASSPLYLSSSLPAASSRSAASIRHTILPAQTIPLPITISTRPGLHTVIAPETLTIHEPAIAKVGEVVQKIPTAVSHQRQTVVHQHASVVTPIVAPAVRTITSQVVRAYHTPIVYAPQAVRLIATN